MTHIQAGDTLTGGRTVTHVGPCDWCDRPAAVLIHDGDATPADGDRACHTHTRQYLDTYTAPVIVRA